MKAELVMPADGEAELSVLAELAAPLHHVLSVEEDDFYDARHVRLYRHITGRSLRVRLTEDDLAYLEHIKTHAWPLTAVGLARFRDCAERRRRLFALELERLELLTTDG